MERVASTGSIIWGHRNGVSSGFNADDNSKSQIISIKLYKRRFYILALFAITAFMQYCCWNTFGPISSTCMTIFDWTEAEIAFMASLDPFTYILTMLLFSWMMDMKGLRVTILVSAFFMAFGTGLRCISTKNEYVTWTMAAGQFFNGLAGPVTQAAPTLLSTNWFPVHERTTATAVASLMGSLGVAMSFIIGPTVVKEINITRYSSVDHLSNQSIRIHRNELKHLSPRYLADSIYGDAKYYWPFDNENGYFKEFTKDRNYLKFQEYKNDYHGIVIGKVKSLPGILNNGITTQAKRGWVNLGDFEDECLGKPSLCKNGLSIAFWVSFTNNTTKQFLLGTGGLKSRRNGFLVSVKKNEGNYSQMKIDVISKKTLWRVNFLATPHLWQHVAITWNQTNGLAAYINSTLVAHTNRATRLHYTKIRGKSFTVGRVNNAKRYTSASFDEIVLWEKTLRFEEIEKTYSHVIDALKLSKNQMELLKELDVEKEELKGSVMNLLFVEFVVNAVLFILLLVYFPDKPPTPPTKSSFVDRVEFSDGVKRLIRSPSFWTLCLIYGITSGVYSGWGSLLNVNLSGFGISQKEAGWLGFYAILTGVAAGMMLARCADLLTGRMKALIVLLFIGASGCFLWFSLLCLRFISYSKDSLYKAAVLGGFFISGTIPLFYELTVEQMYPISEGTTVGLMTLINNIVTVIFLLVLMIPNIGTIWMNWALSGSCIVCLPILALFKEKYNRLNVDMSGKVHRSKNSCETEKIQHSKINNTVVANCLNQSDTSLLVVPEVKSGKSLK